MAPVADMSVCALRISRTTGPEGIPAYQQPNSYLAFCSGIISVEHDPQIEEGEEFNEVDGCGTLYVVRKRQDSIKRVDFTITMGRSDPRINEILGIGELIEDGGEPVGWGMTLAAGCGDTDPPNPVIIEWWSERWDCDVFGDPPYKRHILPLAFANPQGYTNENGVATIPFGGFGQANSNFDNGPFNDLDFLQDVPFGYIEIEDTALPTCPDGYGTLPGNLS